MAANYFLLVIGALIKKRQSWQESNKQRRARKRRLWKGTKQMKIEKKTDEVVYITINGKTVYIDDSTGELIVNAWDAKTEEPIKPTFEQ